MMICCSWHYVTLQCATCIPISEIELIAIVIKPSCLVNDIQLDASANWIISPGQIQMQK